MTPLLPTTLRLLDRQSRPVRERAMYLFNRHVRACEHLGTAVDNPDRALRESVELAIEEANAPGVDWFEIPTEREEFTRHYGRYDRPGEER